jgi:hypothetical protein
MKKIIYIFIIFVFTFNSCTENVELENKNAELTTISNLKKRGNSNLEELKLEFSKALSKSLIKSTKLKEIIKLESLKKFNRDNDVLYQMIKNDQVENGKTVENLIKENYFKSSDYNDLLLDLPTLTIFVPTLPNDSFSPESWKLNENPAVAVRNENSNDAVMVFNDGTINKIEGKYTPSFPVLVVKQNQCIIDQTNKDYDSYKTDEIVTPDGIRFRYIDNNFNANKSGNPDVVLQNPPPPTPLPANVDQKLYDAYTIFNQYPNLAGWQRDYIYYNITPTTPNGPFSYDFQEHLTSFRMSSNDPLFNYMYLTDSQIGLADPLANYLIQDVTASHWTMGYYVFRLATIFNDKVGLGPENQNYFPVPPNKLFDLYYTPIHIYRFTFYQLTGAINKKVDTRVPIFNWDLNQYASKIKISIEEADTLVSTTQTTTNTVKYAQNFSINPTFGILEKVGLKFGATLEENTNKDTQIKYFESNDQLGSVIINFADKIIINQSTTGITTRKYNSGLFEIDFIPQKVQ